MQRVLRKRVCRDLKEHFVRYFMLGLMIAMGIFLVVTVVGTGETLSRGTEEIAEQTNLEDGEFEVLAPLKDKEIRRIKEMGTDVSEQFYFDYQMENAEYGTVRLFKMRDRINQIYYTSGRAPAETDEIVVEKRYAAEHDLEVGNTLEIAGKTYKIAGIGVTSDYDGPFKEISDTSCNSKLFGPVFLQDEAYEAFKESGNAQKSEVLRYAYKLGSESSDEELKSYLKERKVSGVPNLTEFLKREDDPRIFATKNDKAVDIAVGIFAGVLVLILFAYVISVFVVHSIEQESSIIGTLYSMGATKKELLLHYITLPFAVTLIAGGIGAVIASTGILAPMIADSAYQYFSIPEFSFRIPTYLWVYSLLCPPVMAALVNVLVINSKLNKTALSLMRKEVKQKKNRKISLKRLGFVKAFRIRQMLWEMRSMLAVVLGLFLALLIFMIAVNCYTLCTNIVEDNKKDTKYEYMYTLKYPGKEIPEGTEAAYAYNCRMNTLGYNFDVTILGIDNDNPYFDVTAGDSRMDVAVSSALAEKFRLGVGSEFVVTDEQKEMKYAFSVKEITQYSPGFLVFMDIDEMRDMMGADPDYYNVLFADEEIEIDPDQLYATTSREDIVRGTSVFKDLMMPMICTLTFASAVIFCVVMYLMMKVMIDRSGQNISIIKVFGYRKREIRKLYLDGNFYVIALGTLIALPLSKLIVDQLYPYMISNVACGLNLHTPLLFFVLAYAGVLALYLLINTLLVKRLDKFMPAEILKNRE